MSSRSTIFVALLLGSLLAAPVVDAQKHKRRKPKAEPSAQSEAAQPEPVPAPAAEPTEGPAAPADAQVAGAPAPASASGATAAAASDAGSEAESGPDLEALRQEFTDVMDAVVQLRSRVAVLGRQLFETRVRVRVDNQAAETQSLVKLSLLLDGAPVHRAEGVTRGEKIQQVFDGYAAPGPHVLTVEAEQRSKENDKYRYTTRDTFRFEVIRGKTSVVTVVLEDDSGIAEDFPDDEEGEYEVTTRVRVETRGP
jgi:hypothetical protein